MINGLQRKVLAWVADGCPAGVFNGYEHRISAAALKSRGFVTVTGHGSTWQANITPKGQTVLAGPPARRDDKPKAKAQQAAGTISGRQPEAPPLSPTSGAEPKHRALSPTEQLIADLLAAGGVLRVPAWRKQGEPDYQQRVLAAQRFGKVPPGKRLEIGWVGGESEIRLVDAPPGTTVDASPVPVPLRLTRPHPVARQFRNQTERQEVSRAALPRCVRIVHGLATEAERRGFEVAIASSSGRSQQKEWSPANDGHVMVTVRGHDYRLRIAEEKVKTRGPWEQEAKRLAEYPYTSTYGRSRTARYNADATGRLTITLDNGYGREGRTASWADRKSWTLEDKLPDLLRELEVRAAEDDQRDIEAKQRAEEQQRNWELTIDRARQEFLESYRADVLRAQRSDWETAQATTRYLAALEEQYGETEEARPWIEWIRGYIDRLNPLGAGLTLPEKDQISPEELRPFLGGVSPYGPSGW